jgi:hypothetical protein
MTIIDNNCLHFPIAVGGNEDSSHRGGRNVSHFVVFPLLVSRFVKEQAMPLFVFRHSNNRQETGEEGQLRFSYRG